MITGIVADTMCLCSGADAKSVEKKKKESTIKGHFIGYEVMQMKVPSDWIDNGNNTVSCPNCNSWFHLENAHYMYYCGYCGCKMNPINVQENNNYGSLIVTVKKKETLSDLKDTIGGLICGLFRC